MKLAVVGLDGLSPNMIEHCREDLPVLDSVLREGGGGTLRSTYPPVTFPAWTTFTTGKDPGSHGLFNMTEVHADYETTAATPNETDGALYDALDDAFFNLVPATYPRRARSDAILVTGDAPSSEAALPPEIREWEEAQAFELLPDFDLKGDPERYLEHRRDLARSRFELTRRAYEERDPEFMFSLFTSTDALFHYLGEMGDESMVRELMLDIEEYLQWFLDHADNVIVMSDHGFERKRVAAYPNKILEEDGVLETTPPKESSTTARMTVRVIQEVLDRSDLLYDVARGAYERLKYRTKVADTLYEAKEMDVDFEQTEAWHDRWGMIYVNDDRFERGVVGDDEYDEVRDCVIEALSGRTHPDTGEDLFERVVRVEEMYDLTYEGDVIVPDVVAVPEDGVMLYNTPVQDKIATRTDTYNHRRDGVFACVGEAFTDTHTTADIRDIAPTVLHLLGRSVPEDMDGDVPTEVLSDPGEITRGPSIEPGPVERRSNEEEDVLEEKLAALGYME